MTPFLATMVSTIFAIRRAECQRMRCALRRTESILRANESKCIKNAEKEHAETGSRGYKEFFVSHLLVSKKKKIHTDSLLVVPVPQTSLPPPSTATTPLYS